MLVAVLMRGRWDATSNPKGPTDSQGNTWTRIGAEHAYAAYPNSKADVLVRERRGLGDAHVHDDVHR